MPTPTFITNGFKLLKSNSPEILTGLGVAGVVLTAGLAAKAGADASKRLDPFVEPDKDIPIKEKFKIVWTCYIPPVLSGAFTIASIIGASKASSRRTAAAVAAYSVTQRAFDEYKDKVVEELGKGKNRKVNDEIAQDQVTNNPPVSKEVIITGGGEFMCYERYTGRYFLSNKETIDRALNQINYNVVHHLYVCLEEFYDLIGLPYTSESDKIGWESDKLLELVYTTTISEEGKPCLAFAYNYVKPLFK